VIGDLLTEGRQIFQNNSQMRELCSQTAVQGWWSWDIAAGALPPFDVVASSVRRQEVMQRMVAACPLLALKLMLLFLEYTMKDPLSADLAEAGKVHVQYNVVKGWLLNHLLKDEKPEDILAGWGLEASEARMYDRYKRLWSALYNDAAIAESADDTKELPSDSRAVRHIDRILMEGRLGLEGQCRAEAFYRVCPSARAAAQLAAMDSEGDLGSSPEGFPSSGRLHRLAGVVEGPVPVGMGLIGNQLSVYWQARGVALLAGARFAAAGGVSGAGSFPDFLPRSAAAQDPTGNFSELEASCAACPSAEDWKWPHHCLGAWSEPRVLEVLRADTRRALQRSGAAAAALDFLRPRDVVIHLRCFPFFNGAYPLAGFSFYKALPKSFAAAPDLRFLLVA
ncbi:unnamed protein product, partial [Polarella glacialis]